MGPLSLPDPSLALAENQSLTTDEIRRKLDFDRLRASLKGEKDQKAKLREACEGFEAIFIQKIWEQMRQNIPKSGYMHSQEESMRQGMYDQEFARKMASAGGIGLADMLYEQLARRMGESDRSASPGINPRGRITPAGSSPSKRIAGNSLSEAT